MQRLIPAKFFVDGVFLVVVFYFHSWGSII
jgi:hypothetical protein